MYLCGDNTADLWAPLAEGGKRPSDGCKELKLHALRPLQKSEWTTPAGHCSLLLPILYIIRLTLLPVMGIHWFGAQSPSTLQQFSFFGNLLLPGLLHCGLVWEDSTLNWVSRAVNLNYVGLSRLAHCIPLVTNTGPARGTWIKQGCPSHLDSIPGSPLEPPGKLMIPSSWTSVWKDPGVAATLLSPWGGAYRRKEPTQRMLSTEIQEETSYTIWAFGLGYA